MTRPLRSLHSKALGAAILAIVAFPSTPVVAAPPPLSNLAFLPGDAAIETSAEVQDWPAIAAGGPGYLVVWQDQRTLLSGFLGIAGSPLNGNGADIYAARFDLAGNLLDEVPIIVNQDGRNQTRPQVSWNGQNWLVVWTTQREDWYFFEDILGARVSPQGVLLDPAPIPIRLENNDPAGDNGRVPSVTSDGTDWLVLWEDQTFTPPNIYHPTVGARRVAADGSLIDADVVHLHQHPDPSFGPRAPRAAFGDGLYFVVWEEAAPSEIRGKRFSADLTPIDAAPISIANGRRVPRVATDGTDFFVSSASGHGYRVTSGGVVLDPSGIDLSVPGRTVETPGPDVAWNGFDWAVALAAKESSFDDPDLFLARVASDGTLVDGTPQQVLTSDHDEYHPAVAGSGDGRVRVAWAQRDLPDIQRENLRSLAVDGIVPTAAVDTGVGLHRQSFLEFATDGTNHLAVYIAEGGGETRLLAQRVSPSGSPIDVEPVIVTSYPEIERIAPDVAFNGSVYLIVWTLDSAVYGQRLTADLTLLDPAPVLLVDDVVRGSSVGSLGDRFLIAYLHRFSGDQQILRAVRVESDGTVLDTPFTIGFNYALSPSVTDLGGQWLVVWERQPSHDQSSSTVRAVFVSADGVPGPDILVDGPGLADDPAVATDGTNALVVWYDNDDFNDPNLEARLIAADGTFPGPEFVIADPPNEQFFPAVAWTGSEYLVAWADYRHVEVVEPLRGEIFAARVTAEGVVVDPNGFALTSTLMPEDLPAVSAVGGVAMVGFSSLLATDPHEVQRIGFRTVGGSAEIFADGFESGDTSAWTAVSP